MHVKLKDWLGSRSCGTPKISNLAQKHDKKMQLHEETNLKKKGIFTGSKSSLRIPLLGEAFFTSAINPGSPVRRLASLRAPIKSLGGGAFSRDFFSWKRGLLSFNCNKNEQIRINQHQAALPEKILKKSLEELLGRLQCPCAI